MARRRLQPDAAVLQPQAVTEGDNVAHHAADRDVEGGVRSDFSRHEFAFLEPGIPLAERVSERRKEPGGVGRLHIALEGDVVFEDGGIRRFVLARREVPRAHLAAVDGGRLARLAGHGIVPDVLEDGGHVFLIEDAFSEHHVVGGERIVILHRHAGAGGAGEDTAALVRAFHGHEKIQPVRQVGAGIIAPHVAQPVLPVGAAVMIAPGHRAHGGRDDPAALAVFRHQEQVILLAVLEIGADGELRRVRQPAANGRVAVVQHHAGQRRIALYADVYAEVHAPLFGGPEILRVNHPVGNDGPFADKEAHRALKVVAGAYAEIIYGVFHGIRRHDLLETALRRHGHLGGAEGLMHHHGVRVGAVHHLPRVGADTGVHHFAVAIGVDGQPLEMLQPLIRQRRGFRPMRHHRVVIPEQIDHLRFHQPLAIGAEPACARIRRRRDENEVVVVRIHDVEAGQADKFVRAVLRASGDQLLPIALAQPLKVFGEDDEAVAGGFRGGGVCFHAAGAVAVF
ncbi:MAG: hypothetical protein BWY76_02612 [bacterium ADurb.Bin429]|nr:MAG: hypothetical protein BWY76_02612 [bacterium ADurb.Bin429]